MSEKRNRDSKEAAEDSIEQPGPLENSDPTDPVTVGSGKASGGASLGDITPQFVTSVEGT